MVEVDASLALTGPDGPLTLLGAFEGRRQLIAYYFMWNPGRPAAEQCEGCTFYTTQVRELSCLHSRDITYAVFCQGRNVAAGWPQDCSNTRTDGGSPGWPPVPVWPGGRPSPSGRGSPPDTPTTSARRNRYCWTGWRRAGPG